MKKQNPRTTYNRPVSQLVSTDTRNIELNNHPYDRTTETHKTIATSQSGMPEE